MKKHNTWNIRRLVDESFVQSAQQGMYYIVDWRIFKKYVSIICESSLKYCIVASTSTCYYSENQIFYSLE